MKFTTNIPGLTLYADAHGVPSWQEAVTTDDLVTVAKAADELGYDFITMPTHFVMDTDVARTMGPRWVHSVSATGFVLGATARIKVLCMVVVPNHNAIELAKALATLDWMSGGRLVVVPLVGYQRREFEVLDVPFHERGRRMDEYVEVMLELWTAREPSFSGSYVTLHDIAFDPKPVQDPLPLWFGGRTKAALRRLARYGHGWMSTTTPHADFPAMLDFIRRQPAFEANPRPLDVYASMGERKMANFDTHEFAEPPRVFRSEDEILEQVAFLSSVGVTTTDASLEGGSGRGDHPTSVADHLDRLRWFATEVMPEARAL